MMDSILEQLGTRSRHRLAPLLKEREQYLSHLLPQGTSRLRVRSVAAYLIHIVRLMELTSRQANPDDLHPVQRHTLNYRADGAFFFLPWDRNCNRRHKFS